MLLRIKENVIKISIEIFFSVCLLSVPKAFLITLLMQLVYLLFFSFHTQTQQTLFAFLIYRHKS